NRRWSKDQSSLHKNKNNKKKTVKQLKLRVGLIVFWYLKVSFFPDTYYCYYLRKTNLAIASQRGVCGNISTFWIKRTSYASLSKTKS
ncbi:MAG: hypothetical protein MR976_07475, partial [Lactobacillus amylovorus]|nr:hypothetical protein [Lactobacillus amylovorus]